VTLSDKVLRGWYQGMVLLLAATIFLLAFRPYGLIIALIVAFLSVTLGCSIPFLLWTRWLRWLLPGEK
jgi:predicted permease